MKKINSEFKTANMSEEGQQLSNRDYFGYVEMDDFACYVLSDSLDEDSSTNSAKIVVDSIIRHFTETPSCKKGYLKKMVRQAHKELLRQKKGMHLKATIVMAVTDYQNIWYVYVGNSRYYLIRNARIMDRTIDQSLTNTLTNAGQVSLDQAAKHEERNNLYSFLGERGTPKIQVSPKRKLEDGDVFLLLTRGVWEHCSDETLLQIINDAKEPEEILQHTEDCILKEQETAEIDNYTMAVTFAKKIYRSPKKPITLKKILMVAIPVIVLTAGIGLTLFLRHRSIQIKEQNLVTAIKNGESYLKYDNYPKAVEEYKEAQKLAQSLKRSKKSAEAEQYKKLAEQIVLADEALTAKEYQKAQGLYTVAWDLSVQAGNVGKNYIESQLEQAKDYIEVYDLIALGEGKEEYGNLEGAIEAYKAAREKAANLYYNEGKTEALERQAAAEEKLEKAKMEEEAKQKEQQEAMAAEAAKQQQEAEAALALENQQKANDQQNAIDLENQGNTLFSQEQYANAITFYQTAQSIYNRLGLVDLAENLTPKIEAAKAGMEAIAKEPEPTPQQQPEIAEKEPDTEYSEAQSIEIQTGQQ